MSNTTIQLRHSTETGNVPVTLANGEIAINTQDGKLFYADPTGTVQEFSGFPGPSGLDTEIQFNDSGVLGANSRLTFNKTTGTLTVNGTVVANVFSDDGTNLLVFSNNAYTHANAAFEAANAGGGGITVTVDTTPPASGNTIGDIWIDTDTGKEFRWIDDGDSYQWVEFGGAGITGADGNQVFANLAYDHANSAFFHANSSFSHANASFNTTNTNTTIISFAYNHANAAFEYANTINVEDTYARDHSNAAFIQANSAFDSSNTKFNSTGGVISGDVNITGKLISSGNTESIGYFAEKANIIATGLDANNTYLLTDGVVHYHTANSSTNATVSLSGFADIGVGNSVAMAVLVTNNTEAKYITTVQIDGTGTGVTVLWSGGSAPSGGNSSNTDIYSFSVIKTAATPTYTVFASQTQFGA